MNSFTLNIYENTRHPDHSVYKKLGWSLPCEHLLSPWVQRLSLFFLFSFSPYMSEVTVVVPCRSEKKIPKACTVNSFKNLLLVLCVCVCWKVLILYCMRKQQYIYQYETQLPVWHRVSLQNRLSEEHFSLTQLLA